MFWNVNPAKVEANSEPTYKRRYGTVGTGTFEYLDPKSSLCTYTNVEPYLPIVYV